MNLLKQKIIETIRSKGPITFESFMDMALYYPELGYYTSPGSVIGRKGDFYTSSHLHPYLDYDWKTHGDGSNGKAHPCGYRRRRIL
jgi:hypothetical protein